MSQSAFAANSSADLQAAAELLKAGDSQQAYDSLLQKHESDSQNPQEWFLLAMAAKQVGKLDQAKIYFERLLALDENAHRAKLELAEISYRQGDGQKAKQLLLDVKAANPPVGVVASIDRFVAQINAVQQQQKNWRVRASLGFLHDTNVNAGPDDESVTFFGLPFILSDDAQETSDNARVLRLGFDYIKGINQSLGWQSNVSLNHTDYNNLDNLDVLQLSASSGLSWRQNGHMIWSLPIIADRVKIGHENSWYSYSYGVAPQLRYLLNEKFAVNLATSATKRKYQSNAERNLSAVSFSPSVDYHLSDKSSVRFGVAVFKENSGLDIYSTNVRGINAAYFYRVNPRLITTFRAGYSDNRYKGQEAAHPEKRHDKTSRLGVDVVYSIAPIDSEAVLSVSHTNNDSNLSIYEYDRSQVSLSLRKAF